jgi:mannonate dehydratase
MTRRRFFIVGGAALASLAGLRFGIPLLMRRRGRTRLSDEAAIFVGRCFAGIDAARVWDTHVHLLGLGAGGSGCWINPEMQSPAHPIKRFQFEIYSEGIGMTHEETADADYVERLLSLQRSANPRGKLMLMAFDQNVSEDGVERPDLSPFYTPNAYALEVARQHEEFLPIASVHPYRKDAVDRLQATIESGARGVKWLPNAMGIDPASRRCDAFYERMATARLPLIVHAGLEYAVDASHDQGLGNPLRLRRALDAGVTVVVAHCGSLGAFPDLDQPETHREEVSSFELFLRLFREESYRTNLFADISTLTQVHHDFDQLRELLRAPELHDRLLYASDYPLPALRFMISPTRLQLAGLLTAGESRICRELFEYNPLLFDFAVARAVRLRENGEAYGFLPVVFDTARLFD